MQQQLRRTLVFTICFVLICAIQVGWAAETEDAAPEAMPPVACAFEFTVTLVGSTPVTPRTESWYFWRTADQVETRTANGDRGEIWERNSDGHVFYQQIFHRAQRVIDYTPGDLHALQAYPSWAIVTHVVDPHLLGSNFQRVGEIRVLGRRAQRYLDKIAENTLEVWWLEKEQIPAVIRQTDRTRTQTVRLTAVYPLAHAPWSRSTMSSYQHIDYIDLGDKESDPFVQALHHPALLPPPH